MRRGAAMVVLGLFGLCSAACGGAPRASSADTLAIHQPTPDPTLAAVVRDLPKALAGIAATATPTPVPVAPVAPSVSKPAPPAPTLRAAPTARPAQRAASPTPTLKPTR